MNNATTPSQPCGATEHLCHVHETVRLLQMAVGQIEAALTESHNSVNVLTTSFTAMADYINKLNEALSDAAQDELKETAAQLTGMVHQAIIAFQFYDKLTQRIGHVSHSLDSMSQLVGDQQAVFIPQKWVELQATIRSKYTTEEEREMFDAVMQGMPVQQALEHFVTEMKDKGDDIEFF